MRMDSFARRGLLVEPPIAIREPSSPWLPSHFARPPPRRDDAALPMTPCLSTSLACEAEDEAFVCLARCL